MLYTELIQKRKDAYKTDIVADWLGKAYELGAKDVLEAAIIQCNDASKELSRECRAGLFTAIGILDTLIKELNNKEA